MADCIIDLVMSCSRANCSLTLTASDYWKTVAAYGKRGVYCQPPVNRNEYVVGRISLHLVRNANVTQGELYAVELLEQNTGWDQRDQDRNGG
jgi:hypothetical protein